MTEAIDLLRPRADTICIEVTNKCNLRCSYCSKADAFFEAMPGNNVDIPDEKLVELYSFCKRSGITNVSLSGVGETAMTGGWHVRLRPFLDDPDIKAHLVSNFIRHLTEDDLDALIKLDNIQISFDSADPNMVRKLRSKASLPTITHNIIQLRQKRTEAGRGPTISINCTLCRDNIGGIEKLARLCAELRVDRLIIGEVMALTQRNKKMPDTLSLLTADEVLLLARQLVAAQDVLHSTETSFYLQDNFRRRVGEIMEAIREGRDPADADAHAHFHRPLAGYACRQPWQEPFVRADGKVYPCCIISDTAKPVGDLATSTMEEILNGETYRGVRRALLRGDASLPCEGCTLASSLPHAEFIDDLAVWQGAQPSATLNDNVHEFPRWPGLFGHESLPVITENAQLSFEDGGALLLESRLPGLHRVYVDISPDRTSIFQFRLASRGRRTVRLDLTRGNEMIGRAVLTISSLPRCVIEMGCFKCNIERVAPAEYLIRSSFPAGIPLPSQVNITLIRDDGAVSYVGDGRSGVKISDVRVVGLDQAA